MKNFRQMHRDPRHILVLVVSLIILSVSTRLATDNQGVSQLETAIFNSINLLPDFFGNLFFIITQLGSFASLIVWLPLAYLIAGKHLVIKAASSITFAYLIAKYMKVSIGRGRPVDFYETFNLFGFEKFTGFGFPSGHSALAAAAVFTLLYSVRPKYRKHLVLVAVSVGISRISIGAHLPLDVVGGWALGAGVAAIVSLFFGRKKTKYLKTSVVNSLKQAGYNVINLKYLKADAKSSTPFVLDTKEGKFLGKIHGEDDYVNSWAFRLFRNIKYKNFSDEEPFLNIKRQLTNEGFSNYLAIKNGVRSPKVVDIVKYGNNWILLQEFVSGVPFSDFPSEKINNSHLKDLWKQVKKLKDARLAHRDLRSENILVGDKGKMYLIDYGFSEIAANNRRRYIDLSEVLISVALKVGAVRAVKSFIAVFDQIDIENVILYVQYSALSNTTKVKAQKDSTVINSVKKELELHLGESFSYKQKELKRFPASKLINYATLILFILIGVPQFREFSSGLTKLSEANIPYIIIAVVSSIGTYVFSGLALRAIAPFPLRVKDTVLQYVASSYFGRFLPKGAGSAAVGYQYLRKNGFSKANALSTTLIQRVIGFLTFFIPVVIFLAIRGTNLDGSLSFQISRWQIIVGTLVGLSALIFYRLSTRKRRKINKLISNTKAAFIELLDSKEGLYKGIVYSLLVSLSYILALYFSMLATGAVNSPFIAVLSFSVASIAASAAPTPGGLGAMEVSMIAVMASFGIDKGTAFSAVILYRLITFWLPIPFGYVSYLYLRNKEAL